MRSWRVGTVTMGSALLLLGVFLLVSTFTGLDLYPVMMSWWPVILIILGVEILLFLFFREKKELSLKYDVFSILFIGFLGTVAVGFAIVSSIGITEKVSAMITSYEVTNDLPAFEEMIRSDIERIVLETNHEALSIEGTDDRNLHIFGTYKQHVSLEDDSLISEPTDYVMAIERGDTLFITIKDLPANNNSWQNESASMSAQVIVPNHVELEVRSNRTNLSLRPRNVLANWSVNGGQSVSLYIPEESDVMIETLGASQLFGNIEWEVTEEDQGLGEHKTGRIQFGDATHQFRLVNTYEVVVYKE